MSFHTANGLQRPLCNPSHVGRTRLVTRLRSCTLFGSGALENAISRVSAQTQVLTAKARTEGPPLPHVRTSYGPSIVTTVAMSAMLQHYEQMLTGRLGPDEKE